MSANESINHVAYSFNAKLYTLSQGRGEKCSHKVDYYVLTKYNPIFANTLIYSNIKSKIKSKQPFAQSTKDEIAEIGRR